MLVSFDGHYSADLCRGNPLHVFLFGDNLMRRGFGGQAIIRCEPNAFGVPTKREPDNRLESFFEDGNARDQQALVTAILMVKAMARTMDVVVPVLPGTDEPSLGCGLANLPNNAPNLYQLIVSQLRPEGRL
ncbi:hypothetical protein [Sphingomonas jaspsi]|uniref:DUF7831 domain-containing protein n=1 Tax=Sphingomonas jaspsi TaxID=392409 RepID=UPI0004BAD9A6|nr:hypothetical protein [Sphingomonas jaspsi]